MACGAGLGSTSACLDIGGAGGSSACSNNSSSSTAYVGTGSATMGAPMSYANIVIQPLSSNAIQPVTTQADIHGAFEIKNVSSFPILVTATSTSGNNVQYGYITAASQTNVAANPLTTLTLTLASNGNPEAITAPLPEAAISQAQKNIKEVFNNFLLEFGQSDTNDFISKIFNPDHTGLDLLLDTVGFSLTTSGITTLTNKLTGEQYEIDNENINELPFDTSSRLALKDLPISVCSEMLASITSDKLLTDDSIYSSEFLLSGRRKIDFINYVRTATTITKFMVTMPIFKGLDSNGNLSYDITLLNPISKDYISDLSLSVKKELTSNKCVAIGDQFPFEITIQPAVKSTIRVDGLSGNTVTKNSGIEIYIGAHHDWTFTNNYINGQLATSARVEVCDKNDSCQLVAKLTNTAANSSFSITGGNNKLLMVNTPNFSLFTNKITPIKISFFNSMTAPTTGNSGLLKAFETRSTGNGFSSAEVENIRMPEITNASLLGEISTTPNQTSNVIFNYNSGSGVATAINFTTYGSNNYINAPEKLLLKKGSGSFPIEVINPSNVGSRKINICPI